MLSARAKGDVTLTQYFLPLPFQASLTSVLKDALALDAQREALGRVLLHLDDSQLVNIGALRDDSQFLDTVSLLGEAAFGPTDDFVGGSAKEACSEPRPVSSPLLDKKRFEDADALELSQELIPSELPQTAKTATRKLLTGLVGGIRQLTVGRSRALQRAMHSELGVKLGATVEWLSAQEGRKCQVFLERVSLAIEEGYPMLTLSGSRVPLTDSTGSARSESISVLHFDELAMRLGASDTARAPGALKDYLPFEQGTAHPLAMTEDEIYRELTPLTDGPGAWWAAPGYRHAVQEHLSVRRRMSERGGAILGGLPGRSMPADTKLALGLRDVPGDYFELSWDACSKDIDHVRGVVFDEIRSWRGLQGRFRVYCPSIPFYPGKVGGRWQAFDLLGSRQRLHDLVVRSAVLTMVHVMKSLNRRFQVVRCDGWPMLLRGEPGKQGACSPGIARPPGFGASFISKSPEVRDAVEAVQAHTGLSWRTALVDLRAPLAGAPSLGDLVGWGSRVAEAGGLSLGAAELNKVSKLLTLLAHAGWQADNTP